MIEVRREPAITSCSLRYRVGIEQEDVGAGDPATIERDVDVEGRAKDGSLPGRRG